MTINNRWAKLSFSRCWCGSNFPRLLQPIKCNHI